MGLSAHIGHLKRSLNTVQEVIVLLHGVIKSQPLYFLPTQSPNTDTRRPVLALPHKAECKAGSNFVNDLERLDLGPSKECKVHCFYITFMTLAATQTFFYIRAATCLDWWQET